jgi:diguanylate cyclase (GGDEF)-like protein
LATPDRLQAKARRDAVRRRDKIRQLAELRRTLRIGTLIIAATLWITAIFFDLRYPANGPQLFIVWTIDGLLMGALYPFAVRAPGRYIVRLTLLMASVPSIGLVGTLLIEPATLLSMSSAFAILPVAVPLFLGWTRRLRTTWLLAYAGVLVGIIFATHVDQLAVSQQVDISVNIGIGCLIGWFGGELLERPRLRSQEDGLELRRLNRVLSGHATTDPLTDLLNRRRLETDLGLLAVSLRQSNAPCAILMFDLDRFKQLNDELGHAAGDAALRSVAVELKRVVRGRDTVYRYGGEEFVVVLPDSNFEAGLLAAERVRLGIEGLRIPTRPGDDAPTLTISGGVAVSFPPHPDWAATLRIADFALYEAKSTGRNRTTGATPASMDEAFGSASDDRGSPARRAWSAGHRVGLVVDEGTRPS